MDLLASKKARFERTVSLMRRAKPAGFEVNRFPWQTRIVISELLEMALTDGLSIEMLKGGPTNTFYDDGLRKSVERILRNGNPIRMIFGARGDDEDFWIPLLRRYPERLKVLCMPEYDPSYFHYCLAGTAAYRLEMPHPQWDGPVNDTSPERPARFSFNDPAMGQRIQAYADNLAKIAAPLPSET